MRAHPETHAHARGGLTRERKERKGKEGGYLVPATGLDCQPLLGRTYASEQLDPWDVESRGVGSLAAHKVLRG